MFAAPAPEGVKVRVLFDAFYLCPQVARACENNGFTFSLVGHLPEPAPLGSLCPKSFAVGADGSIHALVGACGVAVYYTRSEDGGATWGPAVNVTGDNSTGVGEPRGAKIILDGTGTPVIVWFAVVGGSTEIYSSRLLN